MDLINILMLGSGLFYAIWDDRKGDKHPNHDLVSIGIVMVTTALAVALFRQMHPPWRWKEFLIDVPRGTCVELGWFLGLFNWAINWILWKRGVIQLRLGEEWYNHFSKSAWPDKWPFWNRLHWSIRFAIQSSAFIVGLIIYFL